MELIKAVEQYLSNAQEDKREYIGASSIGHSCDRKVYYDYHIGTRATSPRQQVIFGLGHTIEVYLRNLLHNAGINIYEVKKTLSLPDYPFFRGHCDGVIYSGGIPYAVIDFKTANNSQFNQMRKARNIKITNPSYYAQLQAYMMFLKLDKAVLFAINKNTGEFYEEWVTYDEIFCQSLKYKARKIYEAQDPPRKVNKSPLFYVCQMCSHKDICHGS